MKHSLAISLIISRLGGRFSRDAAMSNRQISSTSFSLKIRTVLIGSPTYFGWSNCVVLYSPRPFKRRTGITLGRNINNAPQNFVIAAFQIYDSFQDEIELPIHYLA